MLIPTPTHTYANKMMTRICITQIECTVTESLQQVQRYSVDGAEVSK